MLADIPIVILAGGLGTRLRSFLPDRPKGLAPIGARSFLEIQIELLQSQGARHFVLCVGFEADKIQSALGDGRDRGVRIDYSVEAGRLLGTAGALKQAEAHFAPQALVLNGDTYFALDYEDMVRHHRDMRRQFGAVATLALTRAVDGVRYGKVALDPSGRMVAGFREKDADAAPAAAWLSGGAYVMERELLDLVPPGQLCSLEQEVWPQALAAGRPIAALTSATPFFDIGTPDGFQVFTAYYREAA